MNSNSGTYSVQVEKEQLIFSAAHFITFGPNICESIHGHNYRVRCHVTGKLNEHGYVIDFIALRDALFAATRRLDHHVLLPLRHPAINVHCPTDAVEVTVTFEKRRWVFPKEDCVLLPISNTTAELLAHFLFDELQAFWDQNREVLESVEIGVDENEGQWGSYRRQF